MMEIIENLDAMRIEAILSKERDVMSYKVFAGKYSFWGKRVGDGTSCWGRCR